MTLIPIESLKTLPHGWEPRRFKFVVDHFYSGGTPSTNNPEYWNGEYPWVSSKDMKSNEILDTEDHITGLALEETNLRLLPPGQILLVVRSGILRHTIPVAINSVPTTVNQDIKSLALSEDVLPKFVIYIIKGLEGTWLSRWRKQGTTVESLEYDFYANDFIPIPPIDTQTKIVAYLDRRCRKIDRLIAKKRGLLALLVEKRSALITRAVTKGLEATAPMKPSGIDWLGDIPAHWTTKRIKYIAEHNRRSLPESTDPELEIAYADISSVSLQSGIEKTQRLVFERAPSRARRIVRRGDVIVSTVRTYLRAIATIEDAPENLIVSTGFAVLSPDESISSAFFGYACVSDTFVDQVVAQSRGVSYPATNPSDIVKIPIAVPPYQEQIAISEKISGMIKEINSTSSLINTAIDQLTEYRAAIIAKAVTGALEVT
jgi:type I restriction enzyme S subunit